MTDDNKTQPTFTRRARRDFLFIFAGAMLEALTLNLFLVPAEIASGGVSGLSQIIHSYTGWPIGAMILAGNLPLFAIGWRNLGGLRFASRTVFFVTAYSLAVDLTAGFLPPEGLSDDLLLNALYGGVGMGIGVALVYRGQGTSGGSDILSRILATRRGIPLSQTYLMTDAFTMLMAGLAFGWEKALYAIVFVYISGLAAEMIVQGAPVVRTAMIVTANPETISESILRSLGRGVTGLPAKGMYTGGERTVLYCVVGRAEVERLKALVAGADPAAFMVIGHAYEALGEGFQPMEDK